MIRTHEYVKLEGDGNVKQQKEKNKKSNVKALKKHLKHTLLKQKY